MNLTYFISQFVVSLEQVTELKHLQFIKAEEYQKGTEMFKYLEKINTDY